MSYLTGQFKGNRMKKLPLLIAGLVVGVAVGLPIGTQAANPLTDTELLTGIKGLFLQAGWTPPSTTPTEPPTTPPTGTKPSEMFGKLWTVMAPFSKPNSTSSPENLYLTKAETDPRYAPYLFMRGSAVVFKTPVNGVHSPNSQYPRTELREMKNESWGEASWSNKSGTHSLITRQAITHIPVAKPEVVVAQIHDGSDDVIQVRLEGKELSAQWNDGDNKTVLDANYTLGTQYDLKIVASGSRIKVSYNGTQKADIGKSGSGWYFKEGSYCQSNPSKGDSPDAYCEVEVYSLTVNHI